MNTILERERQNRPKNEYALRGIQSKLIRVSKKDALYHPDNYMITNQ